MVQWPKIIHLGAWLTHIGISGDQLVLEFAISSNNLSVYKFSKSLYTEKNCVLQIYKNVIKKLCNLRLKRHNILRKADIFGQNLINRQCASHI